MSMGLADARVCLSVSRSGFAESSNIRGLFRMRLRRYGQLDLVLRNVVSMAKDPDDKGSGARDGSVECKRIVAKPSPDRCSIEYDRRWHAPYG